MMKMAILVVIAVAAAALLHGVQTVSLEEMLFESFMSNYSRSYREDPVTRADKFRVFQVS